MAEQIVSCCGRLKWKSPTRKTTPQAAKEAESLLKMPGTTTSHD